jgi:hypothetical protein
LSGFVLENECGDRYGEGDNTRAEPGGLLKPVECFIVEDHTSDGIGDEVTAEEGSARDFNVLSENKGENGDGDSDAEAYHRLCGGELNALAHIEAHIAKHINEIGDAGSEGYAIDEAVKNCRNDSQNESADPRRNVDYRHQKRTDEINAANEADEEAANELKHRNDLLAEEGDDKAKSDKYVRNGAVDGVKDLHKSRPDVHYVGRFGHIVIKVDKIFPKLVKSEFTAKD